MVKIRVTRFSKRLFFAGTALLVLGIFMPSLLPAESLNLYGILMRSIRGQDSVLLLMSALQLVLLNTLRSLPHYLGVFMIVESLSFTPHTRLVVLIKSLLVVGLIPLVYRLVFVLFHVRYDFGVPALVLILLIVFLGRADYSLVGMPKKILLVSFFIIAAQFLDIMPILSSLPVGRGDISREVKYVARFLEMDSVLQTMASVFFALFLLMGIVVLMLVRAENNLRAMNELKKQNAQMLLETRLHNMEERTSLEMRHLVHDLKSPLTSAQALVSLLKMSFQQKNSAQEILYLEKIETSIERMSGMISELLDEKHCTALTVQELFDAVLAQASVSSYAPLIQVENDAPESIVSVNKIRFVRALVNLIENAAYAVESDGRILLGARRQDGRVLLSVRDNGKGIPPESLRSI